MTNLLILFVSYFIVSISLIGYGNLFVKFFTKKYKTINFGYLGIFGLVFSIFIAYLSNFFIPHNYIFNSIYIILGIFGFILLFREFKIYVLKKDFYLFFSIFILAFISLLIFKNHDDFSYYHFVYTYNLTQFDLLVGTGQFNHGFRTPSSIFYINSLFYLPLIKYFSFNFAAVFVLGFSNIILLKKIRIINSKKFNFNNKTIIKNDCVVFFSLLSLIFINIFFYRIGEHGTDRSAQILIMILASEVLSVLTSRTKYYEMNLKIYALLIFIISLKAFYILYLLILIPIYIYYSNFYKFTDLIKKNIMNSYIIIFFIIFLFIISSYFFSSGCLIYPVKITCFENFSWSIPIIQVENMNTWYQQWSKAGAGPDFRIDNPEVYIKYFNWVGNWIDKYFFNKVSDFLLGIIFLSLIIFITYSKISVKKTKIDLNNYQIIFYFLILILFLEWFYNHPSLRYGGFSLVALIFFLPLSIKLSSFKINTNKFQITTIILIFITASVFTGRNLNRINNERILYKYNPLEDAFYKVKNSYFQENKNILDKISNYQNCEINNTCKEDEIKIKKKFGKYIFEN